jgi:hypothetical protein
VLQGSSLLSRSIHIYIASLLHSYSINSVLLSITTLRESYEPGFAYCIFQLLKFTQLPSLWPNSSHRPSSLRVSKDTYCCNLSTTFRNLATLCHLEWHCSKPRGPPRPLSSSQGRRSGLFGYFSTRTKQFHMACGSTVIHQSLP